MVRYLRRIVAMRRLRSSLKIRTFALLVGAICFLSSRDPGYAGDLTVDFSKGLINGKSFEALTIDSLTDLLGKPDKLIQPVSTALAGTGIVLAYEKLGLRFVTDDLRDAKGRFRGMCIYLEPTKEDYSAIAGETLNFSPIAATPRSSSAGAIVMTAASR